METCKFCGKEIPDGGICGCEESLAAAEDASFSDEETETTDTISEDFGITDIIEDDETEDIPTENEEVSADETDPLDFLKSAPKYVPEEHEQTAVPVQNTETLKDNEYIPPAPQVPKRPAKRHRVSKKVLMRRRRLALVGILLVFFICFSAIRNHTGCRGAVHRYWNCVVDVEGGEDYYSMGLPKVLIKHFKDSGEWDNLITNYESLSKKAVKLKKIKKVKRMSKDELHDAEDYLYDLAHLYGAKTADGEIIADKGYFVTVIYKFGDDKILGGAYYVKMEDDCWKVLPHDIVK